MQARRCAVFVTPFIAAVLSPCHARSEDFPDSIVKWVEASPRALLSGTGRATWDRAIRERGFILREGEKYRLWYTGYDGSQTGSKYLGLASSDDGLRFLRDPRNPLTREAWTEDVFVLHRGGTYYGFAEGERDIAHLLTSRDGVAWRDDGPLDIRNVDGTPLSPGPRGTPTVWVEGDLWFLFYEQGDEGVWLATSRDREIWTNVSDEPVLPRGPADYDQAAVALNHVIKRNGVYYGFYHANRTKPWKDWTTCVARSHDLVHWEKYPGNPIIGGNRSSAIFVEAPDGPRLYTMHPDVRLYVNPSRDR
jgi:hypothetical protein